LINSSEQKTKKDQGKARREDNLAYPVGDLEKHAFPKFHFHFDIVSASLEHYGGNKYTYKRQDEFADREPFWRKDGG